MKMKGWARRHSYFTVMGGFYRGEEKIKDLSFLDTDLYPELLKKEDPIPNPDETPTPPHPGAPPIGES